jgi:hypothetical protein
MVTAAVPMAKRGAFPATARRAERRLLLCGQSVYQQPLTTLSAPLPARRVCISARPKRLFAGRWSLGRAAVNKPWMPPPQRAGEGSSSRRSSRGRRAIAGAPAWPASSRPRGWRAARCLPSGGRQETASCGGSSIDVDYQRAQLGGRRTVPSWSASRAPPVGRRAAAVQGRLPRPRGVEVTTRGRRNIELRQEDELAGPPCLLMLVLLALNDRSEPASTRSRPAERASRPSQRPRPELTTMSSYEGPPGP